MEDEEGGFGAARGRGEAGPGDSCEGATPCRDVGLVAVGIEGSLGLEVGV